MQIARAFALLCGYFFGLPADLQRVWPLELARKLRILFFKEVLSYQRGLHHCTVPCTTLSEHTYYLVEIPFIGIMK